MAIRDFFPDLEPVPQSGRDRLITVIDRIVPDDGIEGYPGDPIDFMRDILGIDPWWAQEEITRSVWDHRYTSVASCHGIGKSFITAAIAITFLHCFPNSIVLSTAPTGRQVEHVLWKNIRTLVARSKKPLLGRKPLTTRYEIDTDWYAMGFKPSDQETDPAQGFHAEYVLAIVDEAAGASTTIIDGFQAALTTEGARMLMVGNPTSTSGPFYDSHHAQSSLYNTLTYAYRDTPNFGLDRPVHKGLITKRWVDEVIVKYGERSPYYRSRVDAEWVSAEDVLIPLSQILSAKDRGFEDGLLGGPPLEGGLDVARGGDDFSVLTLRAGSEIVGSWKVKGVESWETVGHCFDLIHANQPGTKNLKIDVIGLGAAAVDVATHVVRERGLPYRIVPVNFSKKAGDPEKYFNQRCEAYGVIADRFRMGDIFGTIAPELEAELSDIRYKFDARHSQPVIEPKDDYKKRTGHSPDYADSACLAFYNPPPDEDRPMGALAFGATKVNWGEI